MKLFNSSRLNANPDGTFKDNDTANGIIGTLINASIFNQIGYETDNLIKAGGLTPDENTLTQILDAIKKLYGDADTALDSKLTGTINSTKSELSTRISNLEKKQAIPVFYVQYPICNSTQPTYNQYAFKTEHEPSTYYQNNFGITTTWELINKTGVFYRCEGGDSSESRGGLFQANAGINATGGIVERQYYRYASGAFENRIYTGDPFAIGGRRDAFYVHLDLSRVWLALHTGNNFRPDNVYMRLWLLKTINGVPIR